MATVAIKCDVLFRVGDYGWSESYYRLETDTTSFKDVAVKLRALVEKRAILCGTSVKIISSRISRMDIRRDSDDNVYNFHVTTGAGDPGFNAIAPAVNSPSLIPNVAIVCRLEGPLPIYHSAHYLSGVPRILVGNDQDIDYSAAWNSARIMFKDELVSQAWCFPVLDRVTPWDDRQVIGYFPATGLVTISPGWGLLPGTFQFWRLINFKKEVGTVVRSFVHTATKSSETQIDFGLNTLPATWSFTRKSVAHPEISVLVPISAFFDERVSHRNRGRPSDSPRGRRKRAAR